ncbi:hypothetical protein BU14_0148s0044 [Porphyra umbilicalis]|uniref:Uncharacterized protein n=1 Tax=Porphyra umbilicalis TaxID=2786 RepID=A0A1X6P9S3_PORUM|nr:hypothetical protein BU14_0148s0044 [Porphyra umbilicalis]OSX77474.1 hypothetical protein BU14_0148s0044 [Porphyra umbilicalis]OSX77475.1 hypothetical protein BU14_0148s0044 [Porphyra umbilicalis]|eukprot:OSX77473.1 hypothetical protein BU14_0148s0044 [Porphyra umbilicalis]
MVLVGGAASGRGAASSRGAVSGDEGERATVGEKATVGKMASVGKMVLVDGAASGDEGEKATVGEKETVGEKATVGKMVLVGGAASGRGAASGGGAVGNAARASVIQALSADNTHSILQAGSHGSAVTAGSHLTLADAAKAVRAEVTARMHAESVERDAVVSAIVAAREKQLQMPWPPAAVQSAAPSDPGNADEQAAAPSPSCLDSVADLSGNERPITWALMAFGAPHTMAMPPSQRSPFRTDKYRSPPRVPRKGLVRKAAVFQATSSPADPPTPPPVPVSDRRGDGDVVAAVDYSGGFDGVGSVNGVDAADAPAVNDSGDAAIGLVPAAGSSSDALFAGEGNTAVAAVVGPPVPAPSAVTMPGRPQGYPLYGGVSVSTPSTPVAASSSAPHVPAADSTAAALDTTDGTEQQATTLLGKRSAPPQHGDEEVASTAPPAVLQADAADELAEQLATRTRNPRLFPAAFWFFDAPAVLAASQRSPAARGLPPAAPPLLHSHGRVGASVGPVWPHAATPPPPPPCRSTAVQRTNEPTHPPAHDEDESSTDMDDDALVVAYVTPPMSPTASHRNTRPSSARRRRSSAARAPRAAAMAATLASQVEQEPVVTTLHDVHHAVRYGFSSVRRELTRLRAELVVVKSQSASALRRMDGVAAAVDGSESGNCVVLERLTRLESVLSDFSDRLVATRAGDDGRAAADSNSATVVRDIKVLLLEALVCEIRTATTSAEVYPTAATVNARLLSVAAGVMKMSESDTTEKLQQKMMLPVRKPAKGMALILTHQYLKRVFGHLNFSLTWGRLAGARRAGVPPPPPRSPPRGARTRWVCQTGRGRRVPSRPRASAPCGRRLWPRPGGGGGGGMWRRAAVPTTGAGTAPGASSSVPRPAPVRGGSVARWRRLWGRWRRGNRTGNRVVPMT